MPRKDADVIKKAAAKAGVSISEFVARAAAEKAAKTVGVCPTCKRPHRN